MSPAVNSSCLTADLAANNTASCDKKETFGAVFIIVRTLACGSDINCCRFCMLLVVAFWDRFFAGLFAFTLIMGMGTERAGTSAGTLTEDTRTLNHAHNHIYSIPAIVTEDI